MKKVEKKADSSSEISKDTRKNSDIARSLALITQLGISMLVPVFLCVVLGLWIDRTFHTSLTLVFLVLGFLSGGRNVWILAKHEGERQSSHVRKRNQYDLMKGWKEEEEDEQKK